jgi:transposase
MRCSWDLRKRVVDFVQEGGSKAEAARRFQVGVASVYRWTKPGGLEHKRPGPHTSHKLDWEALRRRVETHADMTQAEAAQHFGVSRHCIWNALYKMGWTRKKNDRLQRAQPEATKTVSAPSGAVRSARSAARPYR